MLIWVVVVIAVWACLILWVQRRVIYPSSLANRRENNLLRPETVQSLWLDEPRVEGWLLLGRGVSAANPGPAVIFAHGNGELIDDWLVLMNAYYQFGVTSLLVEYRGYGRSQGKPSQQAITDDFVQFYDQLVTRPEIDATRIVFHGRSLGGGVICSLAQQRPPAAMILQSTFTSASRLARRMLVPSFLILDPYDNLTVVHQLSCPLLVIHGRHDEIIPYWHGQRLHAAAADSHLVTYDCGHNDCPPDWNVFWNDVIGFLRDSRMVTAGTEVPSSATQRDDR